MRQFGEQYYNNTKELPPSLLLQEALTYVPPDAQTALDLGCGAGRDTRLLLHEGFHVTAVDASPAAEQYLRELQPLGDLRFVRNSFDDFAYGTYDVINARYSLPFNHPQTFPTVLERIAKALNHKGVFVGQFFGTNDGWNVTGSDMTFLTRAEVTKLLSPLELIKLDEDDSDGLLANGDRKHWHVFDAIAQRK